MQVHKVFTGKMPTRRELFLSVSNHTLSEYTVQDKPNVSMNKSIVETFHSKMCFHSSIQGSPLCNIQMLPIKTKCSARKYIYSPNVSNCLRGEKAILLPACLAVHTVATKGGYKHEEMEKLEQTLIVHNNYAVKQEVSNNLHGHKF